LHGPVRVADKANAGNATVVLSFDAWKGVAVAPTTHIVNVLPYKAGPRSELVSANLVASLVHPDRKANLFGVQFSPTSDRLYATGSSSVQLWDVASKKEIRRIDLPAFQPRPAGFAVLAPDWKTLYAPLAGWSARTTERNGKKVRQIDRFGQIRVWDLTTGKEREPLHVEKGWGPVHGTIAASGRYLVCTERQSCSGEPGARPNVRTEVWDLAAAQTWTLYSDGSEDLPTFLPDGKTVVIRQWDKEGRNLLLKRFDLATGKELATRSCPVKDRFFAVADVAPDGALIAVNLLGGKRSGPREVLFLDGKTLEIRAKLVGRGAPEGRRAPWWSSFTPDGKRFVFVDGVGDVLVWGVAARAPERMLSNGGNAAGWLALSRDSKALALASIPYSDMEKPGIQDPQDLPQPRISLIPLDGSAPARVLIAPHGFITGLAFSPDSKLLALGSTGAVHLFDVTR
jgi:WD40 repeat protein